MTKIRSSKDIQVIHAFAELQGRYKAVLCDIWGVIHNGRSPFEKAVDVLRDYRAQGGRVVLLSNSPRLSSAIPAQFTEIGVPNDFYDAIVTSGDVTRVELQKRAGQKFLHIGPPKRDDSLLSGIDIHKVEVDQAEFVLCSGLFDDETETPEDYRDLLAEIRSRDLLMVCANPDLVVNRGDKLIYCAGAIAAAYEGLGGKTLYGGKPHAPIYQEAEKVLAEMMGEDVGPSDLLMIGDGPKTDIFGAENFGIDSLFVGGGIHAAESFLANGDLNREGLRALFEDLGLRPHFMMDRLC
ncbi:MAG: TIGR01459 family HAD-type hydrolase [Alphaproteobacteria bacterium]|nr:MAG: TIGR01459 family HAD-type hydrolase [Alphaproteobacteria bacterium]